MYLNNKQSVFFALSLLVIIAIAVSCEKQGQAILFKGKYTGTFSYSAPNSNTYYAPVTITFNGNNYSCSSGPDYYPAGGSGTYSVIDNSLMEFKDLNFWTANFDWGLILNGQYTITRSDDKITLSKKGKENYRYIYELNAQPEDAQ